MNPVLRKLVLTYLYACAAFCRVTPGEERLHFARPAHILGVMVYHLTRLLLLLLRSYPEYRRKPHNSAL